MQHHECRVGKSLGAATVIDYTQEDFTQRSATYDSVLDAVGKLSPEQAKQVLKPGGIWVDVHRFAVVNRWRICSS